MGYQMGDLANNTLQTWLTAIPKRDVYDLLPMYGHSKKET